METKREIKFYKSDTVLLSDSAYYKFIFKKTEKIVCSVFYICKNTDKGQMDDMAAQSLLESAKHTLDAALATLSCRWYTASNELHAFLHALIALESNVRVAQAVALLQEEIGDLLSLEIESVARTLRQYLAYEKSGAPDMASFMEEALRDSPMTSTLARSRVRATRGSVQPPGWNMASPQTDAKDVPPARRAEVSIGHSKGQRIERRRAIKDILSFKRQSTIKDIYQKMPEHSEKALQREVVSMIKDSIVIKDGERRWSRYSLAPGV